MIEQVKKWLLKHEFHCGTNGTCRCPDAPVVDLVVPLTDIEIENLRLKSLELEYLAGTENAKHKSTENPFLQLICKHKYPCKTINEMAFKKFKNIHKGETAIIYASGPSLNNYKTIYGSKKFIHAGVNGVIKRDDLAKKLHYYFYGDAKHQDAYLEIAEGYQPKNAKFVHSYRDAKHYLQHINPSEASTAGAIPYEDTLRLEDTSPDIIKSPVKGGGVTFRAVQILLFMGISKLYIVGNDISKGGLRFYESQTEYRPPKGPIITITSESETKVAQQPYEHWVRFKSYISENYPEVEIISINPVHLKGVFKDKFQ